MSELSFELLLLSQAGPEAGPRGRSSIHRDSHLPLWQPMQEEHLWDYAPDNGESCSGTVQPFGDDALVAVTANSTRIGRTYIKALFVEYTDATFKTKKVL